MTRPVQLKTAVPSLEEFGESLGLSKARQKSLVSIIKADPGIETNGSKYASVGTRKRTTYKTAARSSGTRKTSVAASR